MFFAQSSAEASSQTPTAEKILAEIALHCELSPAPDKVLVAGQIMNSAMLHRSTLSLTQAIAMLGGPTSDGRSSVYLLRQRVDGDTRSVTEIDLGSIRTGQVSDLLLKSGDVVFVPHISRGELTSLSRREPVCRRVSPQKPRQLTDAPITPRRSRDTGIRLGLSKL